ncbi:RagB/SusD family nutrient uptake outer membrane protein [Flavobacteriaceae bacterium]|nr:RagB/SusD family nutrient uptake outer membrane protein [Flavobacteriaceae bacterium]
MIFSCESLDIENLNEPETKRVLATSDDYVNVLDGATLQFWNALHKYSPYMTLLVAADFGTSSWGNFNMRSVGTVGEPNGLGDHSALENTVTANYTDYLETPYNDLYSVITSSNDIIIAVNSSDLDEDEKNQSRAYAYFLRGLGYGYVGMLFDKALIFDENTEDIQSLTYGDFVP